MSILRGQAGDSGKLFPLPHIPGSWDVAGDELRLLGQEGRSGVQGRLIFVEGTQANQLRDDPQPYLVDKSTPVKPEIAARAKPSGPIQFFIKLLDFWHLEESDAVKLLGFGADETEYVNRLLQGEEPLHGRDIKERIGHLFQIRGILRELFRDLQTENDWLREKHSLLDERSPMEILLEGSMESLLLVREYVDTIAGM